MSIASDPFEIAKRHSEDPSYGRLAAGTFFPGVHGAVAGKKGRKLRAAGNELGGSLGGQVAGMVVGGPALGAPAGLVGGAAGTVRAHRKGHYKDQKIAKAFGRTLPTARRVQAAQTVMSLKGSGKKTLKAMDELRPKQPVKKSVGVWL